MRDARGSILHHVPYRISDLPTVGCLVVASDKHEDEPVLVCPEELSFQACP